jgi:hypothetical protein
MSDVSLLSAKFAAVFGVVYAGMNVHQLLSNYEHVREKARLFSEIAAGAGGTMRLRFVRALFYLAAPLLWLWTMIGAGLPGTFLVAAGAKFWMSSFAGIRTEHRLLRGQEYSKGDHLLSRVDAALNIVLAVGAVWLIVRIWT